MSTPIIKNSTKKVKQHRRKGPHCPKCEVYLEPYRLTNGENHCYKCKLTFLAIVCTPPSRLPVHTETTASDQQTSCAYHETNVAVDGCSHCGAFICSLCVIDANDGILCPSCVDRLAKDNSILGMRKQIVNYGYLALYMGLGCVIFPIALIPGIISLIYVRKNSKQNKAIGEKIGVRQGILAAIVSILGLIGFVIFWIAIISKVS